MFPDYYKHSLCDNYELRGVQISTYEITAMNRVREEDSDLNLLKHIGDVTTQINFTTSTIAFTLIYRSVKISNDISVRHASVHAIFRIAAYRK